jgi:hypothetical protein
MFKITKKKLVAAAVGVAVVASAGVGYAYWTQSGSGTGTAATGTTTLITVNQLSTPSAMYPGSAPQTLSGDFSSTNPGSVLISSITAVVSSVTPVTGNDFATNGKPDCTVADYAIDGSSGANTVPTGAHHGTWTGLTIQLVNRADVNPGDGNQDNCKNAVAHITYTANA